MSNSPKTKNSNTLHKQEETDPFRVLIQKWLAYCKANGLSDRTVKGYRDYVFKFWWWWNDETKYSQKLGAHPAYVTPEQAREFAVYLRSPLIHRWGVTVPPGREKLAAASIDSYSRAIKVFFNWLVREEIIERTPFNHTVKFTSKNKDRTVKYLTNDEIAKIFHSLTLPDRVDTYVGCRDLALIGLLFDSGMRLGELLSLKVSDVDFINNRCKVDGKTGPRTVLFGEKCRTLLLKYNKHPKHPLTSKSEQKPDSPFWLTSDGLPLTFSGCQSLIRRIREESGVKFHAHEFRHTFATNMAAQGVNAFDLKELLGHASISTTQIYVQRNMERLAEVQKAKSPLTSLNLESGIRRGRGRPRKYQS